jgi:hypothetical protein
LIRGVGLWGATTLNMIDMIGVGPFITIPLIVAAMGGPQAMLGWILGAVLVTCDGLVWAELALRCPVGWFVSLSRSDLRRAEIGQADVVSVHLAADLQRATIDRVGSIGLAQYATYIFPAMGHERKIALPILASSRLMRFPSRWPRSARLVIAVFLLYRRITLIERLSKFLWVGVMLTIVLGHLRRCHAFRSATGV